MRGHVIDTEIGSQYIDENCEETMKGKIRREMVEKLAKEWNDCNTAIERESWRSEESLMGEQDYHSEMAEDAMYEAVMAALESNPSLTDKEKKDIVNKAENEYYAQVNAKDHEKYLRLEVIEELLCELGARMMRPYEHWNEEERYMEYMENRYD